jgi:hypothetical protein
LAEGFQPGSRRSDLRVALLIARLFENRPRLRLSTPSAGKEVGHNFTHRRPEIGNSPVNRADRAWRPVLMRGAGI